MTTPLYLPGTAGDFGGYCLKSRKLATFSNSTHPDIFLYIWACVFIYYIISYVCFVFFIIHICVGSYVGIVVGIRSSSYGSN